MSDENTTEGPSQEAATQREILGELRKMTALLEEIRDNTGGALGYLAVMD